MEAGAKLGLTILGGVSLIALAVKHGGLRVTRYSYGAREPRVTARGLVDRDPANLLPAFADKLELVFQAMRKRQNPKKPGEFWKPILWEGYRSRERAKQLAKDGVGIVDTMHTYGGAADIIDENYLWSNLDFYRALQEEVEKVGLVSGATFSDVDWPHVQAIPYAKEADFKKIGTIAARNNYLVTRWA